MILSRCFFDNLFLVSTGLNVVVGFPFSSLPGTSTNLTAYFLLNRLFLIISPIPSPVYLFIIIQQ